MLKDRLRSGFTLAAVFLAALFLVPTEGGWSVLAPCIIAVLCGLALNEFYGLLRAGGIPHLRGTGIAGGVILIMATWWSFTYGENRPVAARVEGVVLVLFTAAVLVRQMFQPSTDRAIESLGGTLLGFIYVAWFLNFLNKLLLAFGNYEGRILIFYLALVVKMTDVGAFFIGSKLGGRKFFPAISPAKTWSGVFGGMITGMTCSLVSMYFLRDYLHDFVILDAFILGLLLSAVGIVGDLVESLIKRASGAKDSGTMIQGMGGLLDILDSLMFAAPFLYLYMRLFVNTGL